MLRPITLVFALCSLLAQVSATDLVIQRILTDGYVCRGQSINIQFELGNINVLPASGHSYTVFIWDANSNIVFQEEMAADPIEPFTSQIITTYAEWYAEVTGHYTITASVDFANDIDNSNNSLSQNTTAIIPRDKAEEIFTTQIEGLGGCVPVWSSGFMRYEPLQPGDVITNNPSIEEVGLEISLDNYKWFGYYDCDPTARYGKVGYYLITDGIDSTSEVIQSSSPLLINDEPYMTEITTRDTTSERILGTSIPHNIDTVASASTITQESVTPPPDPPVTCAILTGGAPNDEKERKAFLDDLEFMERNLLMEQLGLQLDSNQIRFIGNVTNGEICDAIDNVNTGYDKVLFYYTGHGNHTVNDTNRYGWMSTLDGGMVYGTLASKLSAISAKDICVIVDACYSGEAIDDFKSWFGGEFKRKNITVITGSTADTTTLTKRIHQTGDGEDIWLGFFSWYLVKCYGEPQANMDDDEMISFPEAFHWVRKQNPESSKGPMNDVMDPQIWVCRVAPVKPAPEPTTFHDTGVEVEMNSDPGPDDTISVDMEYYLDSEFTWDDQEIVDISETRTWTLKYKPETSFNLDLRFSYDLEFDELPEEDSTRIGVVCFDEETGMWKPIESEENEEEECVVVSGLDSLGKYALARLREDIFVRQNTPDPVSRLLSFTVSPNPSKGTVALEYQLAAEALVNLNIYNSNGQLVRQLVHSRQGQGPHHVAFDTELLAAGAYQCVLNVNGASSSRVLIRMD